MIYIGIDPGAKGGFSKITKIDEDTFITCRCWDSSKFVQVIKEVHTNMVFCVLEKVHSMPQQGVKSTFNFGQSYGYIKGVLEAYGIPYQEISPQEWKKEFGLIGKDKKESIRVCKQLFPNVSLLPTPKSRVDSDGMAESLLISEFARRKHNGQSK